MSGYRLVTESVSAQPWDDYMTFPIFLLLSPTLLHYPVFFSLFSLCCTIKVVYYISLISTKPTLQDFRQWNQYLAVDSDDSREFCWHVSWVLTWSSLKREYRAKLTPLSHWINSSNWQHGLKNQPNPRPWHLRSPITTSPYPTTHHYI